MAHERKILRAGARTENIESGEKMRRDWGVSSQFFLRSAPLSERLEQASFLFQWPVGLRAYQILTISS